MRSGLFFLTLRHQDMYLPVFCEDRELACSVFVDAMTMWCEKENAHERKDIESFHSIADTVGTARRGTGPGDCPLFLGMEAVSHQCFGGVDSACRNAAYIFAADFEEEKIVTLK